MSRRVVPLVQRFDSLTYLEIEDWARRESVVILPTGSTRQQGPALPVGFDTWLAEAMAHAAATSAAEHYGVRSLLLSPFPYGTLSEHRHGGAGDINVPRDINHAVLASVLGSIADQDFRRLVLWKGRGGADLSGVVDSFNQSYGPSVRAFLLDPPYHEVWERLGEPAASLPGTDPIDAALALYLWPHSVRADQTSVDEGSPVGGPDGNLRLPPRVSGGEMRAPTGVSAELGRRLWLGIVEVAALMLKIIAQTPLDG